MAKEQDTQQPVSAPTDRDARLSRRRFLRRALLGAAAAAGVDGYCIEPRLQRLETVEIPIRGLPAAFDGYRIALLTDFHYPRWIHGEFLRSAITLANSFQPDLMAMTGDFFDLPGASRVPDISGLYDEARARDGVIGVLGNHDHSLSSTNVRRALTTKTPIRLIENRSFYVERGGEGLAIGGVGDLWHGIVAPQAAFAGVPPEMPRLMLSHNPDVAEEMSADVRVDLQLSGHTHGGQVRVPFGPAIRVPSRYGNKFRQGLVEGRRHRVYVSRGLCTVRWVRFWCPPEVSGIILRRAGTDRA